jgi:hypothetical protein
LLFSGVEIAAGFFPEHADDVDHLLRHRKIARDFSRYRVRDLAEMHQSLRAETDDKRRKIQLGEVVAGFVLGFAALFPCRPWLFGLRSRFGRRRRLARLAGLREPAPVRYLKTFAFAFFSLFSHKTSRVQTLGKKESAETLPRAWAAVLTTSPVPNEPWRGAARSFPRSVGGC